MANNLTNSALLERRAKAVPRGVGTAVPIFVDRAENAEIWDIEGNRFIDFASGIAVTNTGHRHPKVIAAARAQLDKFAHVAFQVTAYESYIVLAERLNALAPIKDAKTIMLLYHAQVHHLFG